MGHASSLLLTEQVPSSEAGWLEADLRPVVNGFWFFGFLLVGFIFLLGADLETGAYNHLLSSRMKGKDDPCLYRRET